ncbi:MAG: PorT family protein [Alloprevotella sp.]|nr:PorT family protein [Alloprevotella sp.]
MKRNLFTLALLLTLAAATPAQAGIEFGIMAGMNMSKVNFKDLDRNFSASNRYGFYVGPKVNVNVLGFGADAALLYNQKRLNLGDDYSRTIRSVEIPINARYTLGLGSLASVYAATGPQFGFNVGQTKWTKLFSGEDTTFERKNMNVSWNVGVGAKLAKHVEIGLTYNIALSKYAKTINRVSKLAGGSDDAVTVPANYDFKTNTFQVQVAYLF